MLSIGTVWTGCYICYENGLLWIHFEAGLVDNGSWTMKYYLVCFEVGCEIRIGLE